MQFCALLTELALVVVTFLQIIMTLSFLTNTLTLSAITSYPFTTFVAKLCSTQMNYSIELYYSLTV